MRGTFGNIIPPGPQILMPADITYIIKPKVKLCKNYIVDPGFTNTTQFTGPAANVVFEIATSMMLLIMLLPGLGAVMQIFRIKQIIPSMFLLLLERLTKMERLQIGSPIQLSNFAPGFMALDTAVAINRHE